MIICPNCKEEGCIVGEISGCVHVDDSGEAIDSPEPDFLLTGYFCTGCESVFKTWDDVSYQA